MTGVICNSGQCSFLAVQNSSIGDLVTESLHYAAIESNRELNKSLKVIALLLLIFGPNLMILFFTGVKP